MLRTRKLSSPILGSIQSPPTAIMRLIFDFDGTITEKDTISTFAKAGIALQKTRHGRDLSAHWDEVVRSYLDDYRHYQNTYPRPETHRQTLDEEIKFLAGAEDVEAASLARVEASGVFAGLSSEDLSQMGAEALRSGRITIRDGFQDLLSVAEDRGWSVGVISVNWSRAFIQGVLGNDPKIHVIANEVSSAQNNNGNSNKIQGPECLGRRPLTNCSAKLEVLTKTFDEADVPVVYFGDSTTDIECLVQGAGGVSIAANDDESNLVQTLRRVGFQVPHVTTGGSGGNLQGANNKSSGDGGVGDTDNNNNNNNDNHQPVTNGNVCWARNFKEVIQAGFLEQIQR